jgi:hypothetical protein
MISSETLLEHARRLQRLAQAHVVGEHPAEVRALEELEPRHALPLVRPERRGEVGRTSQGAPRS